MAVNTEEPHWTIDPSEEMDLRVVGRWERLSEATATRAKISRR